MSIKSQIQWLMLLMDLCMEMDSNLKLVLKKMIVAWSQVGGGDNQLLILYKGISNQKKQN